VTQVSDGIRTVGGIADGGAPVADLGCVPIRVTAHLA
jgi:hypothetical protein